MHNCMTEAEACKLYMPILPRQVQRMSCPSCSAPASGWRVRLACTRCSWQATCCCQAGAAQCRAAAAAGRARYVNLSLLVGQPGARAAAQVHGSSGPAFTLGQFCQHDAWWTATSAAGKPAATYAPAAHAHRSACMSPPPRSDVRTTWHCATDAAAVLQGCARAQRRACRPAATAGTPRRPSARAAAGGRARARLRRAPSPCRRQPGRQVVCPARRWRPRGARQRALPAGPPRPAAAAGLRCACSAPHRCAASGRR